MSPTRRQFLAGTAASAAALVLAAACGNDDSSDGAGAGAGGGGAGASGGSDGPWTFVDGHGTRIELERRPERIVAQVGAAAALWDLGIRPVGVFGPQRLADGSRDPQAGNVDLDAVESVGAEYGELSVEALAALEPDLIVTASYAESAGSEEEGTYWYILPDLVNQVREVAPIAVVTLVGRPLDEVLASWADLGEALGADLEADEVVEARDRFGAASAALTEATAEKPGLQALLISGSTDGMYVSHPQSAPDMWYFGDLGLELVTPDVDVSEFFQLLSWERVDTYPADLLLYDARSQAMTVEAMRDQATFAALPAVQADQVAPWRVEAPYSWATYAEVLEELVDVVRGADPDIV